MFPKARDLEGYWANILNRVDAITDVPPTHWRPEDYFDKDPKSPDRTYAIRGGFLSPVDFPPLDFGITPNSLEAIDTTQLLGLLVARDALEDAGYGPGREFDRNRVSVILGVTGTLELVIPLGARLGHPIWRKALAEASVEQSVANDVVQRIADSYVDWQEDSFPGLLGNVAAGRIANRLDLGGTNCVVDAACASSLGALHLATLELASGRSDMVLSGGLDTFNDIFMYMCFSKTPALSPTGNGRPFDTKADGTILGEGLGVVILKRLADAERDGDKIYAVIKGIGSSSDGKGNAIYAPNPAGQAKALRQAYRLAQVTPDTVELVEAHGTGTRAGDSAELTALSAVFQESRSKTDGEPWCAVGSVKSQIGHTKAAAGAAGLIKAALSLHKKVLPPTINVDQPTEAAMHGPLFVNIEKRPWLPRPDHPRRAAVSSFGFGGSNFHCVLEEYRSEKMEIEWEGNAQILAFSAETREGLHGRLAHWPAELSWDQLRGEAARLRAEFNPAHPFRLVGVVERDKTDLARFLAQGQTMLEKHSAKEHWSTPEGMFFGSGRISGKLAFLFPGQGSQYVGMFRDLACQFPQMQEALAEANAAWQEERQSRIENGELLRLSDFIYPTAAFSEEARLGHEEALRNTAVAQPAIGAVSLGALRILEHFGVLPEAVAGHSYGEFMALHAAGRINASALQSLSILRGRLMAQTANGGDLGGMLAVQAPLHLVQEILAEHSLDLTVANKNAPQQYVLSGSSAEISRAGDILARKNIDSKNLPVSAAFHSRFVAEARQPLLSALQKTAIRDSHIPVYANTTGSKYPDDGDLAREMLAGQLAHPVEFVTEIENLYQAGVRTFLEGGPGNKLTGLVGAILRDREHQCMALDASAGKQSGAYDLARALASLAAFGHHVDLSRWDAGTRRPPVPKPALTIPICGANYVKPKPERETEGQQDKETGRQADREIGRQQGKKTERQPTGETESMARKGDTGMNQAKPIDSPEKVAGAASVSEPFMAQALRVTQENLLALQRMSEQTAQLHRQFLEGQDKALQIFQTLLQQHQKLGAGDQGAELPQLKKIESLPQPVATPKSAPNLTPEISELWKTDATPLPVEPKPKPQMEKPPVGKDGSRGPSPIQAILNEVVAEKTGYPPEMLDLDMELDSDLGIDSIKRVEIFSALQERLPQAPAVKSEHLGTLRTLRQVVDFLSASPDIPETSRKLPTGENNGLVNGECFEDQLVAASIAAPESENVGSILLQVISEKTGYPAEMLELDMELDSDLGIDSIKRVEIFSAMQERLSQAPQVKSEHLGSLRTLRQVVEFLSGASANTSEQSETSRDAIRPSVAGQGKPSPGPITNGTAPITNGYHDPGSASNAAPQELRRFILSTQSISPENPRKPIVLAKGGEFWITDEGSGLSERLARFLEKRGFAARILKLRDLGTLSGPSRLAGLIILAPLGGIPDRFLRDAFWWMKITASGLRENGKSGGSVFVTVSRMDGAFGLRASGDPVSGGLAGMAKTAGKEWPEVHCKALDLAADWNDLDAAAKAVGEEIMLDGPVEVGLSQDDHVTLSLLEKALPFSPPIPQNGHSVISKYEVVLVSGGARGVTAEVAVTLARAAHPTLVLIGRSPEPRPEPSWLTSLTEESEIKRAIVANANGSISPRELQEQFRQIEAQREIRRTLQRIQEARATVYYRSMDIRDASAVQSALADIRARLGPIRGLVHGAGVLADRRIEEKTPEQFDQVYSTKVTGLRLLMDALDSKELKLLVLFSSSTARFGRAGQVDYAAANEVLNKLAQRKAREWPHCRVVSVNWGPWDGGMVNSSLKKIFAREGVGVIPLQDGAEFLVREINQITDRSVEVVALADPIHSLNGPISADRMTVAFERTLTVEQFPFLTSHVIDGKAVLPLAMMMEWMAHGALHGNPGMTFHGLDNLRVLRGVILEEDQDCTIRVVAGKAVQKELFTFVPVELRSTSAKTSGDVLHTRAEVVLTTRLPEPEHAAPEFQASPYSRDRAEIYSQLLFHGPHLQGIERVDGCSPDGIKGVVAAAPPPSAWIQVPLRNTWISDPLVLDSAFQLAVLWGYESVGWASLPCFLGRYRQFRRSFPRGSIQVVIRIMDSGAHRATADITFLDEEGRVVARLEKYECVLDAQLNQAFRRNRLRQPEVAVQT